MASVIAQITAAAAAARSSAAGSPPVIDPMHQRGRDGGGEGVGEPGRQQLGLGVHDGQHRTARGEDPPRRPGLPGGRQQHVISTVTAAVTAHRDMLTGRGRHQPTRRRRPTPRSRRPAAG